MRWKIHKTNQMRLHPEREGTSEWCPILPLGARVEDGLPGKLYASWLLESTDCVHEL